MRLVSNLHRLVDRQFLAVALHPLAVDRYEAHARSYGPERGLGLTDIAFPALKLLEAALVDRDLGNPTLTGFVLRSEEHTSELQSLMRLSSAVFCLKTKITDIIYTLHALPQCRP